MKLTERLALAFSVLALGCISGSTGTKGCARSKNSLGHILPSGDVALLYGQPLELRCVLDSLVLEQGYNSSHLAFYRDEDPVDPEFLTLEDSQTLRLHVPRPAMSESLYYCKVLRSLGHLESVCYVQVAVGSKPGHVNNFACVSNNWENLTCTWRPPHNFLRANYTLLYPYRKGQPNSFSCPNVTWESTTDEYECFFGPSTNPQYRQMQSYFYFNLTGYNKFGNYSQIIVLDHFAHVWPSPVNLTLRSRSSHSALLDWALPYPLQNFQAPLVYRMRLYNDVNETWFNKTEARVPLGLPPLNLTGLSYAYRFYSVRVSIRPEAGGENMWSNETTVIFRTDSELPARAPDTDEGGFEVVPALTDRSVRIYWRQILEHEENGENFIYRVDVHMEGMRLALNYSETRKGYFNYSHLPLKPLEFFVVSENAVGQSVNRSRLIVPDQRYVLREPGSFTMSPLGNGTYQLTWRAPDVNRTTLESYTIFWCDNVRPRPYQCEGRLQWERISPTLTSRNFTVSDDRIYQFAISANGYGTSSGMVWASCIIIPNMAIGKIRDLWIINDGSTFIEIGWKLECPDNLGVVIGYKLLYCPIVGLHNTDCREPAATSDVIGGFTTRANVTGLRPYTTYNIQVAIRARHEVGRMSDPLLRTLPEGAPDPPAPPRIANLSNRLALVSWEPPLRDNGVLTYYKVSVRMIPLPDQTSEAPWVYHNVDVIGKTRTLELNNLFSYTNYSVRVQACTVACSQPSEEVHFRTAIGTPGAPGRPVVSLQNLLHHLHWEPPHRPGGTLDLYEVRMVKVTKNSNSTVLFNTTNTELLISERSCQEPGVLAHIYSVRAINYDAASDHGAIALSHFDHVSVDCRAPGDGPLTFWGPWSLGTENTCTPAHTNTGFIWIMGIAGFIIAMCASFMGGRWVWQKIEVMRSIKPILPDGLSGLDSEVKQPLDARILPPLRPDKLRPPAPADEVSLLGGAPSSPGTRDTSGFSTATISTSLSGGSSRRAPSPEYPVTSPYSIVATAPEDSQTIPTNTDMPYVTLAPEIPKRNPEPLSSDYVQVASLTPKEVLHEPPVSLPLTYVLAAPEVRSQPPPPAFSPYVAVDDPRLAVAPPAPRTPSSGYVQHDAILPKRSSVPSLLSKVSEDKRGSLCIEPALRSSEYCRFSWDQGDSLTPAAAPPEE